jgi:hypothetical protein
VILFAIGDMRAARLITKGPGASSDPREFLARCNDQSMRRRDVAQAEALSVLTKLIGAAFVDIRGVSYATKGLIEVENGDVRERIRKVADLFENVAAEIGRAASEDEDYIAILDRLWIRSPAFGHLWLKAAIRFVGVDPDSGVLSSWH